MAPLAKKRHYIWRNKAVKWPPFFLFHPLPLPVKVSWHPILGKTALCRHPSKKKSLPSVSPPFSHDQKEKKVNGWVHCHTQLWDWWLSLETPSKTTPYPSAELAKMAISMAEFKCIASNVWARAWQIELLYTFLLSEYCQQAEIVAVSCHLYIRRVILQKDPPDCFRVGEVTYGSDPNLLHSEVYARKALLFSRLYSYGKFQILSNLGAAKLASIRS